MKINHVRFTKIIAWNMMIIGWFWVISRNQELLISGAIQMIVGALIIMRFKE